MLSIQEADRVQNFFDSTMAQVRRDHAISHVLYALQTIETDMVFFGGTALARTFLRDGRLSEDIDLYSVDRKALSLELDGLPHLIEQEFPQATWDILPSSMPDPRGTLLLCDPVSKIKVQVLDSRSRDWHKLPTQLANIHQRYSDVPPTRLLVPTLHGFIAMKILAWTDRRASRDLFDLGKLTKLGPPEREIRDLVEVLMGFPVSTAMLDLPVLGNWFDELDHQTRLDVGESECLSEVLEWWGK